MMRNLFVATISLLLIAVSFLSCKDNPNQVYIDKVDSLELRLEVAYKLINSLDTTIIKSQYSLSNENLKLIQELQSDDTLTKEIGFLISDYSANRKSCSRFLANYNAQIKEYNKSKEQLNNLRKDFNSNLVPKEKVNEYLKVEGQAIAAFIQSADNMEEWYKTAIDQHKAKHPEILTYIEVLKTQN